MRIIEGHKGCHEYTTRFTGLEGHGSRPEAGVNACEYAARYVGELLATGEALRARAPAGSRFEPPWTTVSVGAIRGGIAHNVIPNRCEVDWEYPARSPRRRRLGQGAGLAVCRARAAARGCAPSTPRP